MPDLNEGIDKATENKELDKSIRIAGSKEKFRNKTKKHRHNS